MILTKFSHALLVRAAAVASILIGMLYMPSLFHFTLSIHGLEPELGRGPQTIEEEWGKWSMIGGGLLFIGSFMLHPYRSVVLRNILLGFLFICLILIAIGSYGLSLCLEIVQDAPPNRLSIIREAFKESFHY